MQDYEYAGNSARNSSQETVTSGTLPATETSVTVGNESLIPGEIIQSEIQKDDRSGSKSRQSQTYFPGKNQCKHCS